MQEDKKTVIETTELLPELLEKNSHKDALKRTRSTESTETAKTVETLETLETLGTVEAVEVVEAAHDSRNIKLELALKLAKQGDFSDITDIGREDDYSNATEPTLSLEDEEEYIESGDEVRLYQLIQKSSEDYKSTPFSGSIYNASTSEEREYIEAGDTPLAPIGSSESETKTNQYECNFRKNLLKARNIVEIPMNNVLKR